MTQVQLDCAVADATGEPLGTVHRLGFSLSSAHPRDLEPEDLVLVIDCPFCGRAVHDPGQTRDGSRALAECDHCDLYFDSQPGEVYAAGQRACDASRCRLV